MKAKDRALLAALLSWDERLLGSIHRWPRRAPLVRASRAVTHLGNVSGWLAMGAVALLAGGKPARRLAARGAGEVAPHPNPLPYGGEGVFLVLVAGDLERVEHRLSGPGKVLALAHQDADRPRERAFGERPSHQCAERELGLHRRHRQHREPQAQLDRALDGLDVVHL